MGQPYFLFKAMKKFSTLEKLFNSLVLASCTMSFSVSVLNNKDSPRETGNSSPKDEVRMANITLFFPMVRPDSLNPQNRANSCISLAHSTFRHST